MDDYIFTLSDKVTRLPVTFENRFGIALSADLYLPVDFDEAKTYPTLIIGAPYGGVKEQGPGIYANEMAQRGYIALTFDPSYNGYSEGEPRRVSSPELFVEDIHANVDFLGHCAGVDRKRIGVIGICGSGGFGLSAAQVDPRIKAVATVSMYDISRMHAEGFAGSLDEETRNQNLAMMAEQRWEDFASGRPKLSPRGSPLQIDEDTPAIGCEFGEFYSRPRGYHPNSTTQFTLSSSMAFMNFPMLDKLSWMSPRPMLLIIGEHAHSRYFSEDVYDAAAEPKELYEVPGANHVDLYDKTDLIPFDKLDAFFTEGFNTN